MLTQTKQHPVDYERPILTILRNLPPERGHQLLTFARFLAFETFHTTDLDFLVEYTENDAAWDALLSSDGGQAALDKLADEALAAIRSGEATSLVFTADGEIAPG